MTSNCAFSSAAPSNFKFLGGRVQIFTRQYGLEAISIRPIEPVASNELIPLRIDQDVIEWFKLREEHHEQGICKYWA